MKLVLTEHKIKANVVPKSPSMMYRFYPDPLISSIIPGDKTHNEIFVLHL